jgi:hypothetical protein
MGHLLKVTMQIGPRKGWSPARIDADHSRGIDPRALLRFGRVSV